MTAHRRIYLVYGNHGPAPIQLDDYLTYLHEATSALDFTAYYSEETVPGALNILIEGFNPKHVLQIRKALLNSQTRVICLATEFITGSTFNDFRDEQAPRSKGLFSVLKRSRPGSAYGLSKKQLQHLHERHRCFSELADLFSAIWCVTPHQLPEYRARYGTERVKLMPMTSWSSEVTNPLQGKYDRDIDVLFTGTMTPHRASVLNKLSAAGYTVRIGTPFMWGDMRDQYVARSKVCVQVLQHNGWKYPSVMRYHRLLCAGAVVVAEKARDTCLQEQFLAAVSPEDFFEACIRAIGEGDFTTRGMNAATDYFRGSTEGRAAFKLLLP